MSEPWNRPAGIPKVPIPDLLSTAVALHALDALEAPWREHRDSMLDFIDTLWTAEGAFHGSWADDEPDAEYTFYGLVALGHASV
jgi:prenyltransferase beta subunit